VIEECVTFPVEGYPQITADWELGQSWGGADKWADGVRAEWDGQRWNLGSPPTVEKAVETRQPLGSVTAVSAVVQRESLSTVNGTASVVVHTTRNPDRESFGRLLSLVASLPGETEVVLKCPAGDVMLGTSSLSMSDSGRVSLILGGAMMTASASADELQAIGAGLSL
jgi:hypothetical protein